MAFVIRTSKAIFTQAEIEYLERYGDKLEELMNGVRLPKTPAQKRFIRVCKDEVEPETKYENVWWKYIKRLEWESDPVNQSAMGPPIKIKDGFGGSLEDWKHMRRSQWQERIRRSRGD